MKKILFVCTGNTCRSPMAELILKYKLKLAGITDIRVSSCGLSTVEGSKISENSKKALKLLGIPSTQFRSKNITEKMIKNSSLVICMTDEHKYYLKGFDNVYTVKELTGIDNIVDPYGQDLSVYVSTSHRIEDACTVLIKKILQAKGE